VPLKSACFQYIIEIPRRLIIPRISDQARFYDFDTSTNCFDSAGLQGGIIIRWLFGTQGTSTQISSGKKECPQALQAAEGGKSAGETWKPSVCDRAGSFKTSLQHRQNRKKDKSQISSTKLYINPKSQSSITQTRLNNWNLVIGIYLEFVI
jgi:hypothetical protein